MKIKSLKEPAIIKIGGEKFLGKGIENKEGTVIEITNAMDISSSTKISKNDIIQYVKDCLKDSLIPKYKVGGASVGIKELSEELKEAFKIYSGIGELAEKVAIRNLIVNQYQDLVDAL